MRMLVAGLLLAAGGTLASQAVPAAEEGTALETLRALSSRTYEASREIDVARHSASAQASTVIATHAADLRKQVDDFAKAHRIGSGDASVLARKLRDVSLLVGNVERARALGASGVPHALVPERKPANARSTFTRLDARHGGRCEAALGLGAGHELDGVLGAGAELWLHVEASAAHAVKVDTAVSPLDTEIAVFDACPAHGEASLSTSDDAFGLAAAAVLEPSARHKAYWLRVRNLGARGEVGVVADETATISGTVSWVAVSPPYSYSAHVSAFDLSGYYAGSANIDAGGIYLMTVAPGSYYVAAAAIDNVTQFWPDIECSSNYPQYCAHAPAQPLTVAAADALPGIDFTLNQGAHIGGRVRDAATGLVIANANIVALPENPDAVFTYPTTQSDDAGRFVLNGLAAGSYHLQATSPRYLLQAFDGVDCPTGQTCADDIGTAIVLARQGAFDQANFNLHPAAFVRFVVHAVPIDWWNQASIDVFDPSGNYVASVSADIQAVIEMGPLVPGAYRFVASMPGQVSQLYDHIDCASDCSSELVTGNVVHVSAASPEPTLTFDLHALASVSGHITDRASGAGLADVALMLWSTAGGAMVQGQTATDGTYTLAGVKPGMYWLLASSADHHDMAYVDAPCSDNSPYGNPTCQLTAATPIVVGRNDVGNIDMTLPMNGTIAGHARDVTSGPSAVSSWKTIALYDAAGMQIRTAYTDALGAYSFDDLQPGTYFAQASAISAFAQVYAGIDCPFIGSLCYPAAGTPIVLAQGTQRTDVDFSMTQTRRIVGRVTDAVSGQGIAGVTVDAWNPQNGQHCDDASTDLDGYYWIDDSGTCDSHSTARWLSTDARPAHVDQVYDGIACPNGPAYLDQCPLTGAMVVAFPMTPTLSRADFSLARPDAIFSNGFDATVVTAMRARR